VFAFPGRVGDSRSEGCNNLIKTSRAGMIENAADLIKAMGWRERTFRADQGKQKDLFPDISEDDKEVMALLHKNTDGLQINQIAMELGRPVSATSAHLMQMEFAGLVRCLPGNLYKLS
jgi:DNA processing protein